MALNYEEMTWKDVRDHFRTWREENERRSDDVIQLWEAVLADKVSKTGNERFLILEQVTLAALDTGHFDIATKCIKDLNAEFPGSLRVMKLKAMHLEAMECYDGAVEILDNIIAKDETNAAPRKRKIAILKAKGRRQDAIKELNDYLDIFMSDQEAWHELCNLYMAEGDYMKASFCMEELLMHYPHSHLIYQRLAEILYTMGGYDNICLARTYYSHAIQLNPSNLRALYGTYLCCSSMANWRILGAQRKEAQKLADWALAEANLLISKKLHTNHIDRKLSKSLSSLEIK